MPKLKDYTGQIHGCWKVIERDKNPKSKSHETFWISECQNCGNVTSVRRTDLDKNPQSCKQCEGIIHDKRSWKIGDKYGLLTIIGKGTAKGNCAYVKVQCDCGSEPFEVCLKHLKGQGHGRTISCGCAKQSSGELKIKQCLTNYTYSEQFVISELSPYMSFDFAIFKNNKLFCLIEYDGEQHFFPVNHFGGEGKFIVQKERDERKNRYCREHGIKLVRIPYYDYDKINKEYLTSVIEN